MLSVAAARDLVVDCEPRGFLVAARESSLVAAVGELRFPRVIDAICEVGGCESNAALFAVILQSASPDFPKDPAPGDRIALEEGDEVFHIETRVKRMLRDLPPLPVNLNSGVTGVRASRPVQRAAAHQSVA